MATGGLLSTIALTHDVIGHPFRNISKCQIGLVCCIVPVLTITWYLKYVVLASFLGYIYGTSWSLEKREV